MIGWYVHHQGLGHLQRLQAVVPHMGSPVTALSSLPAPPDWPGAWVDLARDDHGARQPQDVTAGGTLHWAPEHHDGLLSRNAAIVAWAARTRPDVLVSDVSVEVALLARLLGVPVVVVAMQGDRNDRPHRTAYDLAGRLIAPWPSGLPHADLPAPWDAKTTYVGAFSRFDGRERTPAASTAQGHERRVLVLWGAGGSPVTAEQVSAARAATPGWTWTVRHPVAGGVSDVWGDLLAADVVVVHGGQNAVAEVAAARRPAVVVAQDRPHDEQAHRVRTLREAGLAVGLDRWPAATAWPGLLAEAAGTGGTGWCRWSPGDGAARMAAALDRFAAAHPS